MCPFPGTPWGHTPHNDKGLRGPYLACRVVAQFEYSSNITQKGEFWRRAALTESRACVLGELYFVTFKV